MIKFTIKKFYYDILVLGAGGAGLMAAVHASRSGLKTACISKVSPTRSHTVAAKGGINAALGNVTKDDWRWHMYDTVRGGDWLGDQDAIEYMCQNASSVILELEKMGVPFSRGENGKIYQRIYGGQSSDFGKGKAPHRACAVADKTGHAILHTLYQQAIKNKTSFFINHFAIDLIMDTDECRGVVTWDIENGEICIFRSHKLIIATGGYGQAYETSTSSSICTGDGGAMVLRAGLPLQDMEFIQFHPTGLYGSGFLITEAARSEGAFLINSDGERFMERYAPAYKDLAPRDVIARAMSQEIIEGRGTGANRDHLLLCLQHLDKETILKKLPAVYESSLTFAKVDPTIEAIPVLPSVHYTMGGIPTNKYCEVMSDDKKIIPGLLAIGEAACLSIHGANRLGCNSLLDLVVFGKLAVEHACKDFQPHKELRNEAEPAIEKINKLLSKKGGHKNHILKTELQKTMASYCGVFKNEELLTTGVKNLKQIFDQIIEGTNVSEKSLMWNNSLLEALELENIALQALATMELSLNRNESRGSHFREDYPERNDRKWQKHSLIFIDDKGKSKISYRKVRNDTVDKSLPEFLPEKRKY